MWEVVLLEVYATVGELAERSLLLDLGSLSCVLCAKTCQLVVPLEWRRSIERHWIGQAGTHVFVVSHDCGISSRVVGDCG